MSERSERMVSAATSVLVLEPIVSDGIINAATSMLVLEASVSEVEA